MSDSDRMEAVKLLERSEAKIRAELQKRLNKRIDKVRMK